MPERSSPNNIEILKDKVTKDPAAPEFLELVEILSGDDATRAEAREICLRGLNGDPKNLRGRLLLAKSYYLDGLPEFCVRELLELRRRLSEPSPAIERLLDSFGDYLKEFQRGALPATAPLNFQQSNNQAPQQREEEVLGEIELDSDFEDALEEIE